MTASSGKESSAIPRTGYGGAVSETATEQLWRLVGLAELRLIEKAGSRVSTAAAGAADFLLRLEFEYAEQIARDWNPKDPCHDFVGFVIEFDVGAEVVAACESHPVGGRRHLELWVPAEELGAFDDAIAGGDPGCGGVQRGERVR